MSNEQQVLGPAPKSDFRKGDRVRFIEGDQTQAGEIIAVKAPGCAFPGSQYYPLIYLVDTDEGFLVAVQARQVVTGERA